MSAWPNWPRPLISGAFVVTVDRGGERRGDWRTTGVKIVARSERTGELIGISEALVVPQTGDVTWFDELERGRSENSGA